MVRGYSGEKPSAELAAKARRCPSYPGYSITRDGRVFSHWTRTWLKGGGSVGRIADEPVREIVTSIRAGYVKVSIWRPAKKQSSAVGIHHLLLDAWVEPRPPGQIGRHLDDVKLNNDLGNLAWGTDSDNTRDALRNGRVPRGERKPNFKITDAMVQEIRAMRLAGSKFKPIAARFEISTASVEEIIYRRRRFA